jgi:hypothetical protein
VKGQPTQPYLEHKRIRQWRDAKAKPSAHQPKRQNAFPSNKKALVSKCFVERKEMDHIHSITCDCGDWLEHREGDKQIAVRYWFSCFVTQVSPFGEDAVQ